MAHSKGSVNFNFADADSWAGGLIWESGLIRFLRDLINFPDYISAQYEVFYFLSYNSISFIQLVGIYFPLPMKVKMKVAQSCPTHCNPMDCIIHGILQARILELVAFPFSGDLPNPGIEPRPPTLWADSLSAEPQVKPKDTGVGSLSLLQWIFLTQESNWGLLHCRQILY